MTENSDQVDAAAREAARQTRAGGPQRARLDMSAAREIRPGTMAPWMARLGDRFRQAITTTRISACEHVERAWESGSAIPVHWALWRPDRAACHQCASLWLVPAATGHATTEYCDECGAERPTDYVQLAQGPFVIHADLCDACRGR